MATNYKFDNKTSSLIDKLKEYTGSTTGSEVIRKALALLEIALEAKQENRKILIKDSESKEREIILC